MVSKTIDVSSNLAAPAKKTHMQKLTIYLKESYEELVTKVTWPTWRELLQTAGLVLVSSVLIAFVIFGMDTVISQVLRLIFYK